MSVSFSLLVKLRTRPFRSLVRLDYLDRVADVEVGLAAVFVGLPSLLFLSLLYIPGCLFPGFVRPSGELLGLLTV